MTGRTDPRFLVVGHLNKAHGTKGELFVWPLTDHPESVYAPGVVLHLGDESASEPDPDVPRVRIESVRPFRDREGAERLRGRYLLQELEELAPLGDEELFYHQLLGMQVLTTEGRLLGEIVEVYELRPAHMLEVRGPDGEVMIPFVSHIVVETDREGGRMIVDPPPGLLDL